MDSTLIPSQSRDRALTRALAALLLLGAQHAAFECRPAFALWAIDRRAPWSLFPPFALLAVQVLALAMLLSRWPRACAAAACAVLVALYAAVPATYHNNHYLLFLLLLLVAIAPTNPAAPIDLARIVRWQLALVYLSSVVVKLGHPWWRGSGTILRWLATTRAPEANPDALLFRVLSPLLSAQLPARLAEIAVTALEVALPLGLANRRTRHLAIAIGVLLHLFMQEWLFPQLFTFLMLLGYFAWSPADDHAWTLTVPGGSAAPSRLGRFLAFADPLRRLKVIEGAQWSLTDTVGRRFLGIWIPLRLCTITPHIVIAYAALALLFPEVRAIGPITRDALENLLVGAFVLAHMASSLFAREIGPPGRNSSQPS